MAPLRGWASRGHRLTAKVPHGRWKTMTFLAALRHDRIDAPWFIEGPIDGESFRTYVAKVLLPTLRPGDIVVLDNLGSHRSKAVRQLIRSVGAKLFFLPKYSPDLNPIEQAFAKIKHLVRKAAARTVEPCAPPSAKPSSLLARRMRQLSQKFRLSNLISSCSSASCAAARPCRRGRSRSPRAHQASSRAPDAGRECRPARGCSRDRSDDARHVGVEIGFGAVDADLAQQAGIGQLVERVVDGRERHRNLGQRRFLIEHFRSEVARALAEQQPAQSHALAGRADRRLAASR